MTKYSVIPYQRDGGRTLYVQDENGNGVLRTFGNSDIDRLAAGIAAQALNDIKFRTRMEQMWHIARRIFNNWNNRPNGSHARQLADIMRYYYAGFGDAPPTLPEFIGKNDAAVRAMINFADDETIEREDVIMDKNSDYSADDRKAWMKKKALILKGVEIVHALLPPKLTPLPPVENRE